MDVVVFVLLFPPFRDLGLVPRVDYYSGSNLEGFRELVMVICLHDME